MMTSRRNTFFHFSEKSSEARGFAEHRNRKFALNLVPIILFLLLIMSNIFFLTYQRSESAKQFLYQFQTQNVSELSAGNIYSISARLNSVSTQIPINCLVGTRHGIEFFRKGSCQYSLFSDHFEVNSLSKGGINIEMDLNFSNTLLFSSAVLLLLQIILLLALMIFMKRLEQEKSLQVLETEKLRQQSQVIELQGKMRVSEAIAKMTQMLAHDVRKPFSMLEVVMKMLRQAGNIAEVREILDSAVPEIDQAYAQTNGLINDVMEIGRVQKPVLADIAVEKIVEPVLQEAFRIHGDAKVKLEYRFHHNHTLSVEGGKILRVYANIVGNAIEAMKKYGGDTLWFSSEEIAIDGAPFAKLSIGNNGPGIPREHLDQLFESFFSKKEGGTGLGLAIAKKVITDHGGTIWCESTADENRVEFFFTLPLGATKCEISAKLPSSSQEVMASQKVLATKSTPASDGIVSDPLEQEIETELKVLTARLGRKLQVALVDDDEIYRRAVQALIGESETLATCVEARQYANGPSLLEATETFDAYIIDVDMGEGLPNGYDVTKSLRAHGVRAGICIHSNRTLPEDMQTAFLAGADQCFPKPMGRAHLLRFLRAFVIKKIGSRQQEEPTTPQVGIQTERRFAVLDDSPVFRAMWNEALKHDATVYLFVTPEEFLAKSASEPGFVDSLTAIVTDNHFRPNSETTGIEFAIKLRQSSAVPIFLCSNIEHELNGEASKAITRQIEKAAVKVATLEIWLQK